MYQNGCGPVVAVFAVAGVAREADRSGDGPQHAQSPRIPPAAVVVALARRRLRARQTQPDVRHRLRQQQSPALAFSISFGFLRSGAKVAHDCQSKQMQPSPPSQCSCLRTQQHCSIRQQTAT